MLDLAMLKPGGIVRVVLECRYHHLQGEVIAIHSDGHEDGPIEVRLECLIAVLDDDYNPTHHPHVRFAPEDLEAQTAWEISVAARRYWSAMPPHSTYDLNFPFEPDHPCMVKGCEEKTTGRAYYNFLGSVIALDACPVHFKEWNGVATEMCPELKEDYPYPKAAAPQGASA